MQLKLLQKQAVDIKASVENKLDTVLGAPNWSFSGAISVAVADDKFSGVLSTGVDIGTGQLVLSADGLEPLVIDVEVLPAPASKIVATVSEPRDI